MLFTLEVGLVLCPLDLLVPQLLLLLLQLQLDLFSHHICIMIIQDKLICESPGENNLILKGTDRACPAEFAHGYFFWCCSR